MENEEKSLVIREVWDDEKKKMVTIKPEQARLAAYLHEQVTAGVFVTALAMKRIINERLYLALGAGSVQEYCDTMLPFGRMQAYRYKSIAERFEGILPELTPGEKEDGSSPIVTSTIQHDFNGIEKIGMMKLYELSRIEDADFSEIPTRGIVKIGNEEINIDAITEMTARTWNIKLAEIKRGYSARVNQLEEKVKLLESERIAIESREAEANSKIETARDLERLYGPLNSRYEAQLKDIEEVDKLLLRATSVIMKMKPEEEFPDGYFERLRSLFQRVLWLKDASENHLAMAIYSDRGLNE
jgi:hypothetical protein